MVGILQQYYFTKVPCRLYNLRMCACVSIVILHGMFVLSSTFSEVLASVSITFSDVLASQWLVTPFISHGKAMFKGNFNPTYGTY